MAAPRPLCWQFGAAQDSPKLQDLFSSSPSNNLSRIRLASNNTRIAVGPDEIPLVHPGLSSSTATIALPDIHVDSTVPDTPRPQITVARTSTSKKFEGDMSKQNAPRIQKRHLVRWSDELDKRLLLTIQSECNKHNIQLPWDAIGKSMGQHISGGAVIQHMAKLRTRMLHQGLEVPPPLRRGGGYSLLAGLKTPNNITTSKRMTARAATIRSGRARKAVSDTSDGGHDLSNSDPEYGEPSAKRTKATLEGKRRMMVEDSDDEFETPTKRGKLSRRSGEKRKEPTGGSETDTDSGEEVRQDVEEIVAAGAPFLSLIDDSPGKGQTERRGVRKAKSLVVTLPLVGQIKDSMKYEEDNYTKDSDSQATQDDPNEASLGDTMAHMGGLPVLSDVAFVHAASPYTTASHGSQSDGRIIFPHQAHQRTQLGMTHTGEGLVSPAPRSRYDHFGNMIHGQHMHYSTGFENFGEMDHGHGDLAGVPDLWQNPGIDVFNDSDISAHFENAYGQSASGLNFPSAFDEIQVSNPQFPTTFHGHSHPSRPQVVVTTVPDIVHPHVTPVGGEYSSAGRYTVDVTPSDDERRTHTSWLMHNSMPEEDSGVNNNTDEVFATVGIQDGYNHEYSA